MKTKHKILAGMFAFTSLASTQAINTGIDWIDSNTNLTFYGDVRLRYEVDWDSQTAAGVMRDDRHRGRFRGRFGFNYKPAEDWTVGARVRTGNSRSQTSPHLTFWADDGPRDDLDFVVDRYFVQYQEKPFTIWAGRNVFPFWQQNELFWDEDVTPTGVAAIYDHALNKGALTATVGGFYLPDGGYDLNGQLLGAQLKYTLPIDPSQLTVAGAIHYMHGEEGANNLLTRNGERDYLIGVGNVQWSIPIAERPLALGADIFHNFASYDAADVAPFPPQDEDEDLGYVFSVQYGQLKEKNDWLVAYYYAHIETFAVNASYAQDDWHRWGSGPQTSSSDFEGHEFRVAYAISKNINLMGRLFLVEAITTGQDGNRFRLDLNWRF
ncbi:MAG TPA: putative porin [Verrucomicrobiae bacterium]